jgi:hypothetical protein
MNHKIRFLIPIIIVSLFAVVSPQAQTKYKIPKPPKFTLTFALSYDYALSRAYGDITSCSVLYDPVAGSYIFTGQNYGMLQGGSVMANGKLAVDKKRMFRLTLNLGYSFFYNTAFDNVYKNQWHLFNGAFGMEYNFAPKSRYRPYIGYELMYTLMFGGWQYGASYMKAVVTEAYLKFNPESRFGMAFNSGVEYMINQKFGVTFGGRLVWVNVAPKQNRISYDPNYMYLNDAKYDNGVDIGFRKQIVYFQFVGGISLFLHRK